MIKFKPAQNGFSLLEVLIAVIVLGTGLISLARFQGTVLQDSSLARQRSEAASYAQERMEQFRAYTTLAAGADNAFGSIMTTASAAVPNASASNTTFSRQWTVTPANCTVLAGSPCVIDTQVTWPDKGGAVSADTTLALTGIVARIDPRTSGNAAVMGTSTGLTPPANHNNPATRCVVAVLTLALVCS